MNVVMFPIMVLGGVLMGWLAGFIMERGGYGLKWDIVLGLAGSAMGSWIFWALGASSGSGLAMLAVVAFVGAAIPIVAQRQIWPTTPKGRDPHAWAGPVVAQNGAAAGTCLECRASRGGAAWAASS